MSKKNFKDIHFCVLPLFSYEPSISKILRHISILVVNLGFTIPIKQESIKKSDKTSDGGLFFVAESYKKKIIKFSFLKLICIPIYSCRLHRKAFFCDMFHGELESSVKSVFINSLAML